MSEQSQLQLVNMFYWELEDIEELLEDFLARGRHLDCLHIFPANAKGLYPVLIVHSADPGGPRQI